MMVFHLTCNLRGARPIARRRTAGVRLIARGRTTCPAVRRCARWVLSQAATTLRTGKRCLPRKWHKWQPEKRRMPTGRVCTFFYYKTRFLVLEFLIDKARSPRPKSGPTLGSGRGQSSARTGHAEGMHTYRKLYTAPTYLRYSVRFLFSEEGSLRRSIVNLPAYRLSRSRIPLTPTCERLGMCRSNATKGIEHTDVSYKRPEGPPKPPLLQGQRWLVSSRAVGAF